MASPAFGTAGTQFQATTTAMNVDVPDSVAADDIIVVTAFVDCSSSDATISALPSGFVQAPDSPVNIDVGNPTDSRLYVMWKRATGADSTAGTYDFTVSTSVYVNAQAIRYTGVITSGDPWDVTDSDFTTSGVNDTPAVQDTTTVVDTLLVWAGTNWNGGAWTPPSGFTERRDTGDQVCTVADKAQASAGDTGSIVGTCVGGGKSGAWLGALKSAAAVVDSSSYSPARLPGRIGPDRKVFLPKPRFDDSSAAVAEITGTATETQDNQTSTASGVLGYSGSAAVTQANQTSTASGVLGYSGTVAETQDNQTSTATGVLGYTGTAAETQDNQTSTASGSVAEPGLVGSLAETQDNQTSTASGVLGYSGTSSRTQANQTSTATGVLGYSGTSARTQANQTSTASGVVGDLITGTSSRTQANQTSTGIGVLGYTGTSARTQANQTSTVAGWITISGTVAVTQANQTAAASGLGGAIDPAPSSRTYTIPADARMRAIEAEIRGNTIQADTRTQTVEPATRSNTIPADPRTLVAPPP